MAYRSAAETVDEDQRLRQDATHIVVRQLDGELQAALSILLEPDLRVEVCGFAGAGPTSMTRVHAGIRGAAAAVVTQMSGSDTESGGDVRIAVVPRIRVAATVASAVPAAARGAGRRLVAQPDTGNTVMRPVSERGTSDDVREFLSRRRDGIGEVGVHPGPAVDWRPTGDGGVFQWIDVEDGRYLIVRTRDVVEVVPASVDELRDHLTALVDRVDRRRQANSTSHTAM